MIADTLTKDVSQILSLTVKFRFAMEQARPSLPDGMRMFPAGACLDTSLLLGTYLKENGCGTFDLLRSEWPAEKIGSHAWLERNGWIIDITADQFPDINKPVIVTQDRTWHSRYSPLPPREADYRIQDEHTAALLGRAYSLVLKYIPCAASEIK